MDVGIQIIQQSILYIVLYVEKKLINQILKQMKIILAFCFLSFLFASCNEDNVEQAVIPDGSRDVVYTITNKQVDVNTILTTKCVVKKSGVVVKEFTRVDTLPAIGYIGVEEEVYDSENDEYTYPIKYVPNTYRLFINTK